jgi:TatD DNase family protein
MFDTHAHVHDTAYDDDREAMLRRAWGAGISRIVTIGCDIPDSRRAIDLVSVHGGPTLDASIGIHPHSAQEAPVDIASAFDELIASASRPPIAIGETGLDYFYDNSPRDAQRRVFIEQLHYARERALPLIFHTRDAYDDFTEILRAQFSTPMRGIVHCFTGDTSQAKTYVEEFGLLLGIGGVLTFKNAHALREAVVAAGLEHIVLETDCPYLAPVPYRGQRNEPAFAAATVEKLAELFGVAKAEVVTKTTAAATKFFASTRETL